MSQTLPFDTLKDFFFDIEIAPRAEAINKVKKFVQLPEFLKRSVESIEITEVAEERGGTGSKVSVNFKERVMVSPQEQAALVDSGIVSGRSGLWLDIKFAIENSEEKYTLFTNEELNRTYKQNRAADIEEQAITNEDLDVWQADELAEELSMIEREIRYPRNRYLISPGNTIRITWGYKGKLNIWESVEYTMVMHKHNDSGAVPTTSVECVDFNNAFFDYVTPLSGFSCTKEQISTILNKQIEKPADGKTRKYKNEQATKFEILQAICDLGNLKLHIGDPVLKADLEKKDGNLNQSYNIPTTVTFKDFLNKISAGYNLIYFIQPNVVEKDRPLTLFLYRMNFLKGHPVFTFIWKQGKELKNINRDNVIMNGMETFSVMHGSENAIVGESGLDSKSKFEQVTTGSADFYLEVAEAYGEADAKKAKRIFKQSESLDSARTKFAKHTKVSNLFGGSGGYHPRDEKFAKKDSKELANSMAGDVIKINFTHIGYPSLMPCQCEILGISERYSGIYWLQSVKHVISPAQGYVCQCVARSVAKGGKPFIFRETPKGSEKDVNLQVADDVTAPVTWQGDLNFKASKKIPTNVIKTYKSIRKKGK